VLFLVIEHFRDEQAVHERFLRQGRLLPERVQYHQSWIDPVSRRCFQIMEADKPAALEEWIARWSDIVDFEVTPVVPSAEYWKSAP
jgi:hypothetical protein